MNVSFDSRLGLLMPDGSFDPVLEIRRLRQDLMLRIQRIQQSLALEVEQNVEKMEELRTSPSEESAKSETTLHVASDVVTEVKTLVLVDSFPNKPESETVIPASIVEKVAETVIDAPTNLTPTATEPPFIQVLQWVNAVLVAIGVLGTVVGLGYFVFLKHLTNPQELAIILLVAGTAMVLVGIFGRLQYQYTGNTVPGSL